MKGGIATMRDDALFTVGEAARRLRVSEETIRRMLRDGRLQGKRFGGTRMGWRVPAAEIEAFIADPKALPAQQPVEPVPPYSAALRTDIAALNAQMNALAERIERAHGGDPAELTALLPEIRRVTHTLREATAAMEALLEAAAPEAIQEAMPAGEGHEEAGAPQLVAAA
jgi:excisionase family DNA binding protein